MRREGTLGLFDFALELAKGAEVARNVGASLLLVELDEVVDEAVVEVLATEMGVNSGSQNFEGLKWR